MAKMDELTLLGILNAERDDAQQYVTGDLAEARAASYSEYLRLPYGNEQEGRSSVVSSDVLDTVEGMLPDLIDVFVSSDKAVQFDPVSKEDEEGAKQATDACNYVFYKQNNGFLCLYSAIKDGLLLKTGGLKWCWEEKRTPNFSTYRGVDEMQLAMWLAQNPKAEVIEKDERDEPMQDQMGQTIGMRRVYDVKVKVVETKGKVKLTPIPPDELLISRRHNSILLDECPYVAHIAKRTLSDIREMGYDVDEDDIAAATLDNYESQDRVIRKPSALWQEDQTRTDPAMLEGWLVEEYVLVDFDGDGIAERRQIIRLGDKILSNQEFSHVPIAAWTPYILTHRFDGLSVAEIVADIQRINTEIMRQSLDNLYFANNQRMRVLTDAQGNPMANIDDLLNSRPGGIVREQVQGAVNPLEQPWVGAQTLPMLEYLSTMKENRTGYTRYSQGMDSNSLNKTARGVSLIMNASQKRAKLMSRIVAEALVAPTFRGIFKTLTDYNMEKLSFRLRNQYVQYDPQEWRDGYDMTINVGLGTGDKEQQHGMLMQIAQAQAQAIAAGGLNQVVTLQNVYNLQARMVENAGFKDADEFWADPSKQPPKQAEGPPQPDPNEVLKQQTELQKAQISSQTELQKAQIDAQTTLVVERERLQHEDAKHSREMIARAVSVPHPPPMVAQQYEPEEMNEAPENGAFFMDDESGELNG
jgi:hypothetical protein